MAKVDTNLIRLAYARETTAGIKAPIATAADVAKYTEAEPNDIGNFGSTVTTTARSPISNRLQRQKGAVTALEAAASFPADITVSALLEWLPAAIFARWQHDKPDLAGAAQVRLRRVQATGAVPTDGSEGYTFAAGTFSVAALAYLKAGTLVWASDFNHGGNNGLKVLNAAATAVKLPFADSVITAGDEATKGYVSLAGYRYEADSTQNNRVFNVSGGRLNWTMTQAQREQLAAMLKVGQMVHFGSVASAGGDLQNGVATGGDQAVRGATGFARLVEVVEADNVLVFDRLPDGMATTALGTGRIIDLIFSDFCRNVPSNDADYLDRAYTLALESEHLFGDGNEGIEFAVGAKLGPLVLNFPAEANADFAATFTAQDVEPPADVAFDATSPMPKETENKPFSTVADFARMRLETDDAGIYTDFKSLSLTIDPQIAGEGILGKLGAKYINRGNLLVNVEATVIFASDLIPKAIRDNETASFDIAIANEDGAIMIDIPAMTIGGGARSFPANQAVTISGTGESFEDDDHEASIMVSHFAVPIPAKEF